MKHILLAVVLIALPVMAVPIISPEVHLDGSVTFRLPAAKADKVQLHLEGMTTSEMTKGTNGIWTITTRPLAPDIYTYSFDVDGARVIDPNNPFLKFNLLSTVSQVEVPGPASLPWQLADVPRGELHRHFYRSAVCHDDRDFMVYTPPGYKPAVHKRYPVLYLLHGFSDDTTAWTQGGRANVIIDNLIASGQAKSMIVVMPLGYGNMDVLKTDDRPVNLPLHQRSIDLFAKSLLTEIIPMVEKEYRVSTDSDSRAIAGLSMGGEESLLIGLNHPDKFAWIGAFSSGSLTNSAVLIPHLDAAANKQLRLLWISCGGEDKLYDNNRRFCAWLQSKGVGFTWTQMTGEHSYRVWRRNLAAFAPLLFQR